MSLRTVATVAGLIGLGILVSAASPAPSSAQAGGAWVPAGAYDTAAGGEVWMINTETGQARNCFWQKDIYGADGVTCVNSR